MALRFTSSYTIHDWKKYQLQIVKKYAKLCNGKIKKIPSFDLLLLCI